MIPTPELPQPLVLALWALAVLGILSAGMWRLLRWLLARIDERFVAAMRSEAFEKVVDRRVTAAFHGALEPLVKIQTQLAAQIASAERSASAAHRRIDEHLESLPRKHT